MAPAAARALERASVRGQALAVSCQGSEHMEGCSVLVHRPEHRCGCLNGSRVRLGRTQWRDPMEGPWNEGGGGWAPGRDEALE